MTSALKETQREREREASPVVISGVAMIRTGGEENLFAHEVFSRSKPQFNDRLWCCGECKLYRQINTHSHTIFTERVLT